MFYNRGDEQKKLLNMLKPEPALVHFIYGPINSGKTNLVVNVLENLPERMLPFYINLRRRDISTAGDFLSVLFDIDRKRKIDNTREYIKELLKGGADALKKATGIPVPARFFELFFAPREKGEDVFKYLETFFRSLVEEKKITPLLVLDELQMIKNVANSSGNPMLEKLLNFMVGITKETHLCHCFAISSDSTFIMEVHGAAKLHGRSRYILIDDLDRSGALEMYDDFGFKNKEAIWKHIGGKIGDMVLLDSYLQTGYDTDRALDAMHKIEVGRLKLLFARLLKRDREKCARIRELSFEVAKEGEIRFEPESMRDEVYCMVDENVLFIDPVENIVKMQGRLVKNAVSALK